MSQSAVIGALMGAALISIMFGMGLLLGREDFRRVRLAPRAVFIGSAAQMLLLPSLAVIGMTIFGLPAAAGVGLLLVAICPGGPISNFFSHVSGGDGALAVTLTVVSKILCLVSLPAFFTWTPLANYAGIETVPALYILKSLLIGVVAPIATGMVVRHWRPDFAKRAGGWLERLGFLLILGVLSLIMYHNRESYAGLTTTLLMAVMFVNVGSMVAGHFLARITGQPQSIRITYAYEVGLQNIPLATVLAYGLFSAGDPRSLVIIEAVIGLYAIVSISSALAGIAWFRRGAPARRGVRATTTIE